MSASTARRPGPRVRLAVAGRRRWPRWLAASVAVLLVAVLAVYVWARLSTDSSIIARALIWMNADVGDQHRFPARSIPARGRPSWLPVGPPASLRVTEPGKQGLIPLDEALGDTTRSRSSSSTTAPWLDNDKPHPSPIGSPSSSLRLAAVRSWLIMPRLPRQLPPVDGS